MHFEPRLRQKAERTLDVGIDLVPPSPAHPTDREWVAKTRKGRISALAPWLSVCVTAFVVFAPAAVLSLLAHFGAIRWERAGMLLGLTLMISCVAWLAPGGGQGAS
jgi:hypothetical protein